MTDPERVWRKRGAVATPAVPDSFELSEPAKLEDPAKAAAMLLLCRALATAGTTLVEAGGNGVVVMIKVTDDAWLKPTHAVWREAARGDTQSEDGYRVRHWTDSDWFSWIPTEAPRAIALTEAAETFAQALASGSHCLAVTGDERWIPSDLVMSADHSLSLPQLVGADVQALSNAMCGNEATIRLSDREASALSPRLLRLARRRRQTADEYVLRLRGLLTREAEHSSKPIKPPQSMREAPTLDRLHGMEEAVRWGFALAQDLKLFKAGEIAWQAVDRGLLLSGPPGVGKTLYARALAATCGVPLITGSYSDWHGSGSAHQGDLLKAMRKTFATASERAPAILFIDEIDSFPNRASVTHAWADWEIQVVNALLQQLDGAEGRDGVVVIGACNLAYKLDPALTRSGRLDRHVRIGLPDIRSLAAILREHLDGDCADQDLVPAAVAAVGSTGADVEVFVRGARRRARCENRPVVLDDLMQEVIGLDDRNEQELWLGGVHEAGHAVACADLMPGKLEAISLRRSGTTAGFTVTSRTSGWLSGGDVRLRLKLVLAGRAAEEILLGEPTSGAGGGADSDLAVATGLAASAAASLGLDPEVGLVWLGEPDGVSLPRVLRDFPLVSSRARGLIQDAYLEVLELIRRRVSAVRAVAFALVERRALEGSEVERIVREHSKTDGVSVQ
ncbi:MAG: AAA family ATPase [Rhodopila sp.]|jgi:AAA+ superfamily predicted ATPase